MEKNVIHEIYKYRLTYLNHSNVIYFIQLFSVCGDEYTLDIEQHNKFCLLIGILREFLPRGKILGTSLSPVVRVLFYI